MKKTVSIIGSTGSIGLSTLKIVEKKNLFKINLLSADKNFNLIVHQIKKYKPKYFVVNNHLVYLKIKSLNLKKCKILNKFDLNFLHFKNDILVSAIPGIAGLKPTIDLLRFSKKLLIANKESIVCGWNIIKKIAKKFNTEIVPLDSEHFSLSKLIKKHKFKDIKKFYITASGGPFLNYSKNQFKNISPAQALKHPKWKMGKKISVDSATLMNKILELIEAQKLFNIPNEKIDIVIHPESLVHAIIELKNGLTEFIYHETSMIIPIANAIFDGDLSIKNFLNSKNKFLKSTLNFKKVDKKKFPLIKLKNLANKHPSTPIIINAANEIAVDRFLNNKIPFHGISRIILGVLKDRNFKENAIKSPLNLDQIIKINNWARLKTISKINKVYVKKNNN